MAWASPPHQSPPADPSRSADFLSKGRNQPGGGLRGHKAYHPKRPMPPNSSSFWRRHWGIENRVHWVRDVTLGEDRCQVRTGVAPQVMATLRNMIISLIRRYGKPNIAAA